MSVETAKVISRKDTRLYKRGLWLSPAGVFVVVGLAEWLLDRPHLYIDLISAGVLTALYLYFLQRMTRFHTLVDEVIDCGGHLQISKGRMQTIVSFSNIARASLSPPPSLMSTVIIDCAQPTELGKKIEFLTECKLRTEFTEAKAIAENLTRRAGQARA